MPKLSKIPRSAALAFLALVLAAPAGQAQQGGVFTAGDLWETFLPTNVGKSYRETGDDPNTHYMLMRVGNLDRQWTSPSMMYPGGENIHLPWEQQIQMVEYNPDPNFNTATNSSDPRAGHYAYGVYLPAMHRADVSTADEGTHWVDPDKRHTQMYEGLTPTTLGVDVKYRIRQYSVNHGNLNDFIAIEMELTNTGEVDLNADGVPDRTDNRINALTMSMRHEPINSMTNRLNGRRGASGWFTGPTSGYDATPDADGNPWDVPVIFSGPSPDNLDQIGPDGLPWAADGSRLLGNTMNRRRYYYDTYAGFQFIAAKQGALPADGSSIQQADKRTIFDSHPVGDGPQRGWYTTVAKDSDVRNNPLLEHSMSMGVWFDGDKIGNRGLDYSDANLQLVGNLVPDPNWFDPDHPDIEAGNPVSFINAIRPEGERGQPRGDMKYNGTYSQNWEKDNASNWPSAPDEGSDWDEGFAIRYNFDGKHRTSIGPFSLEVGETMNLVLIEYGGFRLQGVRKARKAGQWAYENNWEVPEPPPTPDMSVAPTPSGSINVKWDNRAESAADFAGYKIYRSTPFPNVDSQQLGTRLLDHYHEQTKENPTNEELAAFGIPNNPNISSDAYRPQEPNAWGPYHLVKNIPRGEVSQYLNGDDDSGTFQYAFEDDSDLVAFGFTYWYYVAAYDDEGGEIAGKPFQSLETHRVNFNGKSGLWEGTYHYATASAFYPSQNDVEGIKAIGAPFVLKSPLIAPADIRAGITKIRVQPNPYKVEALHDTGQEHKILFSNLPTGTKITILDVSGQIIDVLRFEGTNPVDGTLFWDMFSKDGIEVTSGLYIYVAQYPGGKQTGHFAILR
jgi:hypothetical protein